MTRPLWNMLVWGGRAAAKEGEEGAGESKRGLGAAAGYCATCYFWVGGGGADG